MTENKRYNPMIKLEGVSKYFQKSGVKKIVANNINVLFPTNKSVAILGRNGAGKTTLLRMIAGQITQDRGRIERSGSVSWPVGFGGGFHRELSAAQNIRFIARIYGIDTDELLAFAQEFADIGKYFYLPIKTYSSGMHSRLSFGVSMGICFDTYLVDEVMAVGDANFKRKCQEVFDSRLKQCGAIVVSHSRNQILRMCESGVVLENGQIEYFPDVRNAIERHEYNMKEAFTD